jgi:hypothetical protein
LVKKLNNFSNNLKIKNFILAPEKQLIQKYSIDGKLEKEYDPIDKDV